MGVKACKEELYKHINSDAISNQLKELTKGFSRSVTQDLVKGINDQAVELLKSGKASSDSEALHMALDIKDEETANKLDDDKHNAKFQMITLAERRLVAEGVGWNSKDIESLTGSDKVQKHKSNLGGSEDAHLANILQSRGGLLDRLDKLKLKGGKAINLLENGKVARQVVTKIMSQDYTDDDIGKLARAIDEHNDHMIKLYRMDQVG